MKLNINDSPSVVFTWIDKAILAKTTDTFYKTIAIFGILNYQELLSNVIIEAAKTTADKNGFIDIDKFCDNLKTAIEKAGGSTAIPLGMFTNIPFIAKLTINVDKDDIDTLAEIMKSKGVN